MGSVEIRGPDNPPTKAEYDFEGYNWSKAREVFKTRHKNNDKRHEFLQSQTTGFSVKETCLQLQSQSDAKYFKGLGGILSKIDTLMKVGDLAIKSAPESVGLAWMGVRMCLHAVQGDFATFQLFTSACADIIGIMISCRVYGKMYGGSEGPQDFQELHSKVVDYIPNIYSDILDFSYAVRKYIDKHLVIRIGKNIFKDVKSDFQSMMDGIQAHESKMRDFAKIATDRLLVHFQKQGLKNQDMMQTDISFMKEALDANLKANEAFVRHIEALEEERKDMRRKSPYEKAKEEFEENKRMLNPTDDQSEMLVDNLEHRRERGTCRWILELDEYIKWHDSAQSDILWVSGAAGYGKSILMSTVIESLQAKYTASDDTLVQYFFCKTGDDATQTTTRILQTIAYHLYESSRDSPELLEKTNETLRKTMPRKANEEFGSQKKPINFEAVYGGLFQILDRDVFLIIDAIDECNDRKDKSLLHTLRTVASAGNKRLKILVCSRPEADIADALNNVTSIKCENHNESDIRKSVTAEMNKFPGWTSSEKLRACAEIVRKAGGQFRYVQIALDFLRKPLVRPYERTIEKLPEGLTGSYITSWKQTDPDYIELLKTALTWTILAKGKMRVPEIMDAFSRTYSSDAGVQEVQEDAVMDEESTNLHDSQVRFAGGNFLDVSSSRVISLRHATVKDFFLEQEKVQTNGVASDGQTAPSNWSFSRKHGQLEVLKTIVQNLASPAFQKKYLLDDDLRPAAGSDDANTGEGDFSNDQVEDIQTVRDDEAETPESESTVGNVEEKQSEADEMKTSDSANPAIGYDHEEYENDDLEDDFDALWDSEQSVYVTYTMANQNFRYELVHWESHLTEALKLWPKQERQENPEWKEVWACLVKFFFHSPVAFHAWQRLRIFDEESCFYTGRRDTRYSPLQVACILELVPLAEVVIEQGVDVNERTTATIDYGWRQSPLEIAADCANIELIRFLLDNGADPNASDNGPSAFSLAVDKNPTCECIRMFLDRGAKVETFGEDNNNVMHYFSNSATDPEALNLLIGAGADINVVDTDMGETPLHRLMQRDNPPVMLLEAYLREGAQVNFEDKESQRPLYEASMKGLLNAARLLIEHGADVHDEDNHGMTALHAAARAGHVEIVKLLLEKRAAINQPDKNGRTPLYLACQGGHQATSKHLIESLKEFPGEETNRCDKIGKTPLRMAAAQGSADTIELLLAGLDAETAINASDTVLGQTSVHAAAYRGRKAALEILLGAGGDPFVKDKNGDTPLQSCGQGWYRRSWDVNESVLLYLVERNEEIAANCPDLLFVAAIKGSAKVVDRLLDAGVDPNSKDEHGWTALLLARQNDHRAVIDTLTTRTGAIRTKPMKWAVSTQNTKILENGLLVVHTAPGDVTDTIVSDHPVPAGQAKYYYEVEMISQEIDKSGELPAHVVGMTTMPARLSYVLPGLFNPGGRTWGWHGDDGFARSIKDTKVYGRGEYGVGDVIGCAVDFDERVMFFTRNGERQPTAFTDVWGRLYPALGGAGTVTMKTNFGEDLQNCPFVWADYHEWFSGR